MPIRFALLLAAALASAGSFAHKFECGATFARGTRLYPIEDPAIREVAKSVGLGEWVGTSSLDDLVAVGETYTTMQIHAVEPSGYLSDVATIAITRRPSDNSWAVVVSTPLDELADASFALVIPALQRWLATNAPAAVSAIVLTVQATQVRSLAGIAVHLAWDPKEGERVLLEGDYVTDPKFRANTNAEIAQRLQGATARADVRAIRDDLSWSLTRAPFWPLASPNPFPFVTHARAIYAVSPNEFVAYEVRLQRTEPGAYEAIELTRLEKGGRATRYRLSNQNIRTTFEEVP